MSKYGTVIGLETHAQLLTESKMFCSCSTKFGAKPNTNICPVCTGQPGVLPVLNKRAVALAIKTAIALNCRIEKMSIFARKNYFYPDNPKDYQISQYELPLATGGHLEIVVEGVKRRIGITRIHLEEDAGKLVHKGAARIMGAGESLVDFNRAGTPLMEIVTEPDIRSPLEAKVFMETLQHLLQFIGVCDAKMEEGSLRCDANISLRPAGETKFGTKTEVKNMNSFRAVWKALEAEEKRHAEVLDEGGKIAQETRFFDDINETTIGMRSKEYAHDYRYFPEPDLVPIEPEPAWVEEIKRTLGELPEKRKERFVKELGLPEADAEILISTPALSDYFEACVKTYSKPKIAANWIMGDLTAYLNANGLTIDRIGLTPGKLAEMLEMIDKGTISGKSAKTILVEMLKTGKTVHDIVKEQGLTQISDEGELIKIVEEVIKQNPKQVEEFKSGKETVIMFLVGQVMKASKGRAKADRAQELLRKKLI
ncbi:MAG TPA: Asp-tRNA(Asn)/Glu-tRNA(Gln) amidotransferase subunit GatB [Candidatus Omnitrophota bacterium]|nr:Asp-tRNA(Asn)/Glu-tRNA(Gln) amidotransferase subunit GatB [Candidatus Omnitrophota bacterium]